MKRYFISVCVLTMMISTKVYAQMGATPPMDEPTVSEPAQNNSTEELPQSHLTPTEQTPQQSLDVSQANGILCDLFHIDCPAPPKPTPPGGGTCCDSPENPTWVLACLVPVGYFLSRKFKRSPKALTNIGE